MNAMTEYLGVGCFSTIAGIKRHLLLFDKIAIRFRSYDEEWDASLRADMEWLRDKGIVIEPPAIPWTRDPYLFPCSPEQMYEAIGPDPEAAIDPNMSPEAKRKIQSNEDYGTKLIDFICRFRAVQLTNHRVRAVSVYRAHPEIGKVIAAKGGIGDVLRVAVQNFPRPAETVSLEGIIRFRDDPKTRKQMVRFRHWLNGMATKNVSGNELLEELENLINEYEEHMRFHKIKASWGALEIVITTIPGMVEDVLHGKPGKASERLFSLAHQRLELMGAELKAPGREVSYVVSAKNFLSKPFH